MRSNMSTRLSRDFDPMLDGRFTGLLLGRVSQRCAGHAAASPGVLIPYQRES